MFGHQNLAEQTVAVYTDEKSKWKFDLIAESRGYLAILPFAEIKTEIRRNPKPLYKFLEIVANQAYETTHYNMNGTRSNPTCKFVH